MLSSNDKNGRLFQSNISWAELMAKFSCRKVSSSIVVGIEPSSCSYWCPGRMSESSETVSKISLRYRTDWRCFSWSPPNRSVLPQLCKKRQSPVMMAPSPIMVTCPGECPGVQWTVNSISPNIVATDDNSSCVHQSARVDSYPRCCSKTWHLRIGCMSLLWYNASTPLIWSQWVCVSHISVISTSINWQKSNQNLPSNGSIMHAWLLDLQIIKWLRLFHSPNCCWYSSIFSVSKINSGNLAHLG